MIDVLGKIDSLRDAIISGCSNLSDRDCLPGTKSCKIDILNEKHEFDAQVRKWLDSVESTLLINAVVNIAETTLKDIHDGDIGFTYTRRSSRSSSSTVSYKRKEGFVKLLFLLKKGKRKDVAFPQKINENLGKLRKLKLEKRKAEDRLEELRREASSVKKARERELREKERVWDAKQAKVEAEAWDEVMSNRNLKRSHYITKDEVKPSEVSGSGQPSSRIWDSTQGQLPFSTEVKLFEHVPVPTPVSLIGNCSSDNSGPPRIEFGYHAIPRRSASWQEQTCSAYRGISQFPYRNNPSHGGPVRHCPVSHHKAIPVAASYDYPPPKPVIQIFDGDPSGYWSFMRSFDTHMAQ